jgi:class 3 adenylate cyclase/tetratricopeptide (TPR) repeat protein
MTEARATPRAQQISATAVFADLVGFAALARELGTERAYLAVTPCLRILDEVVRKHGGSVDKYAGDKLLGVFGYPLPLPGHAEAAARAALEMKRRVAEYAREMGVPLDFHAGLNSGDLVAGDIRGPVVREFHVLGDVVNTAARLNAKTSPGEIYVGETTWQETRERLSYRALPPFQLKGKKQPVPAYALDGAGVVEADRLGEPGSSVALVGRRAELAALRAAAEELAAGRSSALALIGPEGSGKSRLLAELAQGPALAEGRMLQLQCAHLAGEARERAATELAGAVLGRELGSLEEVTRALPELAEATQARPLALALEDVDRLRPDVAASLAAVITALASGRLLLLMSTNDRGAAGYAQMAEVAGRSALRELELAPLAPAEAEGLLETLGLDAETRALVIERSGGLPGRLLLGAFGAAALRSERELEQHEERRRRRTSEAERRRVAVLFADISGFTAMTESQGAERAYPVVAGALHLLEEIARKHGGTVDHFLGDCVMALFGVPEAIEDAPRAAVNAAIEIRERIERYNDEREVEPRLAVHSGIATGLAITGDISGPLIREYAVMGEHVDRGDEFCHEAERGEIYVDGETHRFTSAVFDYADGRPVSSRDEPEPLPSYAVRSRQTKLHRERIGVERRVFSKLVGREPELAALGEALSALEAGRGSIAQLIAEAGVGKSRLVTELEALAGERGIAWLEGRSLSTGRNLAYHPFADLLRSWAGTRDDEDEQAERARVAEAVRALLPELASDVLPFVLRLQGLALEPADERRLAEMPADALERMTRRAVQEVIRGEARRQPLVLVMDDLHWADASSIELLEATLRQVQEERLLLLLASRPGWPETAGRIQAQAREKHADRNLELTLLPLGAEAVRRMVRNLFPGGDLPYETRTLIEERARGNPFYIEEVVRALADQGAVEYRDGAFRVTRALESAEIPGTVQEVVMARVDRLTPERKSVLQAAAVVGGTFHASVLETMGAGAGALHERLSELCDGEFLVPADRTRGVEYAFKHPLLQEVTYDSLLETRRQALHREAGEAIETRLLGTAPGVDAMLAYHFGRGLDPRAEEYLFRAGDEAARSAASSEALHFFEEASALYFQLHGEGGDPEKKARLEANVAQALFNRGREPDSVAHFDGALTHLGVPPARNALSTNLHFVRDFAAVLARLYLPFGSSQHAATEREREVIRLMFQRALAQTTSDPTRFLFDSVATMRRIVQVDERTIPSAGRNYAGAVGIFSYGGISFGIGRRFLDRAGQLLEGDPDAPDYLYYRAVGYIHHFLAGDWSEAREVPDEVVERHLHAGRLWEANAYWSLLAEKRTRVGDFEGSRATLQRLYEIGDSLGYQDAQLAAMGEEAFLLLEQGRFDEAIAKADDYYEESPQDMLHVLALGVKAKAQLRSGKLEEAEASLARADAILAPMGLGQAIPYHVSFERTARLAAELVRYEAEGTGRASKRLRRRRRAALANARLVAGARPEVFRLVGREAFLRGARGRALRAWKRSLSEAERLGIRTEHARTLHEIGLRVGPGGSGPDGRSGAECLAAARDSYRELHLNDELGRLEQGSPP